MMKFASECVPLQLDMPKPIIVAIDGFSSCGKSTVAKQLAKQLSYIFIDSGAMYRAVTLYFIRHNIDLQNNEAVEAALNH
ncbi:MAG: Cytidylate kinase, partial [Bacteroidota bacterium]